MARTADPGLVLVVDPDDDVGCLEQLRRLHARPYGQILCEHDPTATSTELARYLLAALGKHTTDLPRRELWSLVDCHLQGERVRELAVARAHTLSYPALRNLPDHAHRASAVVWLLTAGERPTAAVAQLLEARPHEQATVHQLIQRWSETIPPPEPDPVPPGAGPDYPYLTYRTADNAATRARLCAGLPAAERATVTATWRSGEDWIIEWVATRPDFAALELADALYRLTCAGDTGSELLVRAQAAITALHRGGFAVDRTLAARDLTVTYGETRPYQWPQAVSRAAVLADEAADPQLAAVIALNLVYRHAPTVRRATVGATASDGSIVGIDWGGLRAIPPPLRRALVTQRQRLVDAGARPRDPLLPGTSHGRMSAPEIQRALGELDAPTSMWHEPPDEYFDGPGLDGRTILHALNPVVLFDTTSD